MATDAEIIQAARKLEAALADSDAANRLLVNCQTELSRAETAAHEKEMLVKECRYNMTRLLTPVNPAWKPSTYAALSEKFSVPSPQEEQKRADEMVEKYKAGDATRNEVRSALELPPYVPEVAFRKFI